MFRPRARSLFLDLPAAALLLASSACSTSKMPMFEHETFGSTGTYSRSFQASEAQTCEAARRALLSQGYIVDAATATLVKGHKSFQPDGDTHIQIDFNIVCAPEADGTVAHKPAKATLAFVNAVQDRYALKKSNNSASVGVGVIGSVSLPFSSSDDSLVKVASETIAAPDFYARYFSLVERYLAIGAGQPVDEPTAASQRQSPSDASAPAADASGGQ